MSARDIAVARLNIGKWPLYEGTRNRRLIQPGDKCLFYLAGRKKDSQHVIASGEVSSIDNWSHSKGSIDDQDLLSDYPEQVINVVNVKFITPISIKTNLDKLSFIKPVNHYSWGGALQGGCKKLEESDYKILNPINCISRQESE